ncbi:hypothetical protein Leryth_023626 [Lithospermum erythrorhizon]|nr:hypothetical protein Leryth_023626 [Lithospermum erythrorhizon]
MTTTLSILSFMVVTFDLKTKFQNSTLLLQGKVFVFLYHKLWRKFAVLIGQKIEEANACNPTTAFVDISTNK